MVPDLELIFILLEPAGSSTAVMLEKLFPDRYVHLIAATE